MKVIEQNIDRTWITSEVGIWAKAIVIVFSIFTFSMFFWGGNTYAKVFAIIGGCFWASLLTSIAHTIFDVTNNMVYSRYQLVGFMLRDINAPLGTSKILSTWGQHNPNIYLQLESGKKYRIGDFFTINDHDNFIGNLLKYVPIKHDKSF